MKRKNNKEVTVVSNFDSMIMTSAQHYGQKKKIIKLPQPAYIQIYSAPKGYVGVMDQMVSTYKMRMRQKKWWWLIFFSAISYGKYCIAPKKKNNALLVY